MTKPTEVIVSISDPWEFPDENGGRLVFVADVVDSAAGEWIMRFRDNVVYKGRVWHYGIPTTRHVGQAKFGDPSQEDFSANILFITDAQAKSSAFRRTFNPRRKPSTPWVIGSVEPLESQRWS